MQHIVNAVQFVKSLTDNQTTESCCPFQFDVVIAYPKVRRVDPLKNNKRDVDDSENEEPAVYIDPVVPKQVPSSTFFGDIKKRLNSHGLKYASMVAGKKEKNSPFRVSYGKYKEVVGGGDPRGQRLCVFIDRGVERSDVRQPDEVIMFQPPKDVRSIPHDAVPEWEFNAAKTCIIPSVPRDDNEDEKGDDGDKIGDITSVTAIPDTVDGQLLVLSFHVKSQDCIRCWMHINGQVVRFMPEDITDVLPLFFDHEKTADGTNPGDWAQTNGKFTSEEPSDVQQVKEHHDLIQRMLQDPTYDAFQRKFAVQT